MSNIPGAYNDLIAGRHRVVDWDVIDGITYFWISEVSESGDIDPEDKWVDLTASDYLEWYRTRFYSELPKAGSLEEKLYKLYQTRYHIKTLTNHYSIDELAQPVVAQIENTIEYISSSLALLPPEADQQSMIDDVNTKTSKQGKGRLRTDAANEYEIGNKERALMIYYLEKMKMFSTSALIKHKKFNRLFAYILDIHPKNISTLLPASPMSEDKVRLQKVKSLFEELDLPDIAEQVSEDLKKLE